MIQKPLLSLAFMSRLIKNQRILGNIVSLPDQEVLHKNLEGLLYKNE